MRELNLNWKYAGTLGDIKQIDDPCVVYVFVYSGNPKRIIYVGTAITKQERWKKERNDLIKGRMFVFRVEKNADIYDLMSYRTKPDDPIGYYQELASASPSLLWVPIDTCPPCNQLNTKDDFKTNWELYVREYYLNHIELWYAGVLTKEKAEMAETLIQQYVSKKHLIGYYIDHKMDGRILTGQTWLGRPGASIKSQGLPDDLSADFADICV